MTQFIDWRQVPRVGIPIIDHEHEKLVAIINHLHRSVLGEGMSKPVVLQILLELFDYTVYHFQTEDRIMKRLDFPGLDEHSRIHENLQDQVLDFASTFFEYEADIRKDLLDLFKDWLVVHIVRSDCQITEFIQKRNIPVSLFDDVRTETPSRKEWTIQDSFFEIRRAHQEIRSLRDRLSRVEERLASL